MLIVSQAKSEYLGHSVYFWDRLLVALILAGFVRESSQTVHNVIEELLCNKEFDREGLDGKKGGPGGIRTPMK